MIDLILGANDLSRTLSFRTNAFFYSIVHDYLPTVFQVKQSFIARTVFEIGIFDILSELIVINEKDLLKKEEINLVILEEIALKTAGLLQYLAMLDRYEEKLEKKSIRMSWEVIYYILHVLSKFYFSNLRDNAIKRLLHSSEFESKDDENYISLMERRKRFLSRIDPVLRKHWGNTLSRRDKELVASFLVGLERSRKPFLKKLERESLSSIESMRLWKGVSIAFLIRVILDLVLTCDRLLIDKFTKVVKSMLNEISSSGIFTSDKIQNNNWKGFMDKQL